MKQRVFMIMAFILALVLFGPGPVSAKKIVVLSQFPLSGPLGSFQEIGWGYIDAMNWFNNEAGGLNGKKIDWYLEDMRYSTSAEVANFTKYAAQFGKDEFLMASGYITDALKALIDKVNVEEKLPWVDGSFSTEIFGDKGGPSKFPFYYTVGTPYASQIKVLIKWINENYKGPGKAKVAFVYSPRAYGRDGPPEGIAYAKKLGMKVVAKLEYPYTATNATNECMVLRKAKAQYVIYHGYTGTQSASTIFFKTAKKIIPKTQLLGTHYMGGRIPILLMGDAYNGFIYAGCWMPMDAVPRSATPMNNAMVKLVHEFAKKYRPEAYKKGLKGGIRDLVLYQIGMTYAFMIQEGLKRADNAGDLSRAGIKKALDNMVWDFNGMFSGKSFAYKSHRVPMMRLFKYNVRIVKMKGKSIPTGVAVPITDWINTDEVKW